MKIILKMAWRNIWRNKRRTTIAISSVFFAAFLCMLLTSFMQGSDGYIVDSVVERYLGHFQIMNPNYWEDKTVDNFSSFSDNQIKEWEKIDNVALIAPKMETFAMAWNGKKSKPIELIGIDPNKEKKFSKINERLTKGSFLTQKDDGLIIGGLLAKNLSLNIGDTLALVGQGYHGASAYGLFVIRGIINASDAKIDASIAYTSISCAQNFIGFTSGASYACVLLKDKGRINETISEFKTKNKEGDYTYKNWEELIKDTMAGIAKDEKSFSIFFYMLYIVVGFGLIGTIIMMTNEREKEFGVMSAIGMKKKNIIGGLFLELLFINIIGLIISIIIATPIITYLHYYPIHLTGNMAKAMDEYGMEPIMPFALDVKLFINQIIAITIMAIITAIYPLTKISKLSVIETIRK